MNKVTIKISQGSVINRGRWANYRPTPSRCKFPAVYIGQQFVESRQSYCKESRVQFF